MSDDLTTRELDALFGEVPLADDDLEDVRQLFASVRQEFAALPAPAPRSDLAVLFRDTSTRDLAAPIAPAPRAVRRTRPAGLRLRLAGVAASIAAVAGVTTGLAAAQVLPSPIQHFVDDAFDRVGIHLPTDSDSTPRAPDSGHTPSTGTRGTPGAGSTAGAGGADGAGGTAPGQPPSASTLVPPTVTAPSGPVTLPPVSLPSVSLPPVSLPGSGLPPVTLPPISLPPLSIPLTLPQLPPLFP